MSVAVPGGTFDPIQRGHIGVARAALDHPAASLCILMVGDAHCHRPSPLLPRTTRIELVRAAVANEPGVEGATTFGVCGSSMLDVARALCDIDDELHFAVGADSARRLVDVGRRPTVTVIRDLGAHRLHRRAPSDVKRWVRMFRRCRARRSGSGLPPESDIDESRAEDE